MTSDVELLRLELETLWGSDERGRVLGSHHLVAGVAPSEVVVAYGADEPDELVERLAAIAPAPAPDGERPAFVAQCQRILDETYGGSELSSGPGYLIPHDVAFDSPLQLADSAHADVDALLAANPGTWDDAEWEQLVRGDLGPFAMAVDNGRAVAICHAPAATSRAAEAGVWTDPDYRGRGLAAAVTARWARVASGLTLFYSTSADNHSSQRVAARLGLRPIGWLWKLSRPGESGHHAGRR